ncbi:hypothetical protein ACJVDH_18325 [Pedobacter sp. AW1-32]|uniref:hypothetical protein n=1 Tax=Pedobacter sp. AW1-32 TaxID=3383026 RepID=UPI003FEE939D
MKPVNSFEIKKSYRIFILNFVFLTFFSIFCVFLYFAASDHEYSLLQEKVKETERLLILRKDINTNLDLVLLRFRELSRFKNYNADELSKQEILLQDIQNTNFRIKALIAKKPKESVSFDLYDKLNNTVGAMAGLQDSLLTTRYSIERYRSQLDDCLRVNKAAANRIRSGRFGR